MNKQTWIRIGLIVLTVIGVAAALLAFMLVVTAFDSLSRREGYRMPATFALLALGFAALGFVLIWFCAGKRARNYVFAGGFALIAVLQVWEFFDTYWYPTALRVGKAGVAVLYAALAFVFGRLALRQYKSGKKSE